MTIASQATLGSLLDRKGREIYSIAPEDTVYNAIAQMSERVSVPSLSWTGGVWSALFPNATTPER